jgi:hypothetical protein
LSFRDVRVEGNQCWVRDLLRGIQVAEICIRGWWKKRLMEYFGFLLVADGGFVQCWDEQLGGGRCEIFLEEPYCSFLSLFGELTPCFLLCLLNLRFVYPLLDPPFGSVSFAPRAMISIPA